MVGRIRHGPVLAAFATIYVIWGSTYFATALALQSMPPFLLVGARSVAAVGPRRSVALRSRP